MRHLGCRLQFACGLILLAGLAAAPAFAQSQAAGGTIVGRVTDESGGALPGATVVVRNQATGLTRQTTTDEAGAYGAPLLPVGTYEVTAALDGFATTKRPDLALSIGSVLTVDLALQVAAQEETITVTAEAPVLEAARTAQASTVSARAVENLPVNGRNFIDFVLTTPGVTRDTRLGDISFAGQRGTLNSLVVDGADNNNTFFGQSARPHRLGPRALPVQPGRGAGVPGQPQRLLGRVRPRRRRGDQRGHQVRHQRLPRLALRVLPRQVAQREQLGEQDRGAGTAEVALPLRPVRRLARRSDPADKAFFFVSYDGQRNDIPNPISLQQNLQGITLPADADTQAGLAKLAQQGRLLAARPEPGRLSWLKADWQLSSAHRLSAATTARTSPARTSRTAAPPTPRSTPATAWSRPTLSTRRCRLGLRRRPVQRGARAVGEGQGAGRGQQRRSRGDRPPGRPHHPHHRPQLLQPARDHHRALAGSPTR